MQSDQMLIKPTSSISEILECMCWDFRTTEESEVGFRLYTVVREALKLVPRRGLGRRESCLLPELRPETQHCVAHGTTWPDSHMPYSGLGAPLLAWRSMPLSCLLL